MYHCHVHFYLFGKENRLFELIKGMPTFENFTHEFCESSDLEKRFAEKADVIFAYLGNNVAEELPRLMSSMVSEMKDGAELILLADKEQVSALYGVMENVKDIWILPMSDEELKFRFLRWQQRCKADKDAKQTSHFFESTINSIPNLIWYKDKNGIHEKVNDSFCKTVNKTKAQVEGRGHAYIWDVEQDDPACNGYAENLRVRRDCSDRRRHKAAYYI